MKRMKKISQNEQKPAKTVSFQSDKPSLNIGLEENKFYVLVSRSK